MEGLPEVIRIPNDPDARPPVDASARAIPRAARVERKDLEKFGYTKGCRKCDLLRAGSTLLPSLGHSDACRK